MGSITKTIDFHGDTLMAIEDERGAFIPLRPMVEAMKLDWSAQLKRVKRDPILCRSVAIMATESDRQAVCLPLRRVAGFLFTIDASRIKDPAIQAKVLDYQDQCFDVLDAALRPQRPEPTRLAEPSPALPTEQALSMVREARHTFDRFVGREVWFATGLMRTPRMSASPVPSVQGSLFTYDAQPTGGRP